MLKNGIFCEMVILVIFKGFLLVKNLEILVKIVPDRSIYYYSGGLINTSANITMVGSTQTSVAPTSDDSLETKIEP